MKEKFEDRHLEKIANLYGCISRLSRTYDGEYPGYEPKNEDDRKKSGDYIDYWIKSLNDYLDYFNDNPNRPSAGLTFELMERKGLFLDLHPIKKYKSGYLKNRTLVYLGHIIDKREIDLGCDKHLFLRTMSDEENYPGSPYPVEYRKNPQIYTNGSFTWFDDSKYFQHNTDKEWDLYHGLGLELPKKPHERFLDNIPIETLIKIKKIGEENYTL